MAHWISDFSRLPVDQAHSIHLWAVTAHRIGFRFVKNVYSITRPDYPRKKWLTILIYISQVNSHAILDEIFRNSPAIRTQFTADNSHPITTWQLLVMLTLKQSDATEPTPMIIMTFVIPVDIYDILRWSEFFKLNIVDHMYIFSNIYFSCIRK